MWYGGHECTLTSILWISFVSLETIDHIVNGKRVSAHMTKSKLSLCLYVVAVAVVVGGFFLSGLEKWTNCKKKKSVIMSWYVLYIFGSMKSKMTNRKWKRTSRASDRVYNLVCVCERGRPRK